MRLKWPMIAFAVMAVLWFVAWRYTAAPLHLWMSGMASGLFLFCAAAELIGKLVGKPIWITSRNED